MDGAGSKSRSLGQRLLEKSCLLSRGHNFYPIVFKCAQDVCLGDILDKYDHGWCGVKK